MTVSGSYLHQVHKHIYPTLDQADKSICIRYAAPHQITTLQFIRIAYNIPITTDTWISVVPYFQTYPLFLSLFFNTVSFLLLQENPPLLITYYLLLFVIEAGNVTVNWQYYPPWGVFVSEGHWKPGIYRANLCDQLISVHCEVCYQERNDQ